MSRSNHSMLQGFSVECWWFKVRVSFRQMVHYNASHWATVPLSTSDGIRVGSTDASEARGPDYLQTRTCCRSSLPALKCFLPELLKNCYWKCSVLMSLACFLSSSFTVSYVMDVFLDPEHVLSTMARGSSKPKRSFVGHDCASTEMLRDSAGTPNVLTWGHRLAVCL